MDEQIDLSTFSKKERKKLKRELEQKAESGKKKLGIFVKLGIGLAIIGVSAGGWFLFSQQLNKPLPGIRVEDLGRDHVAREKWESFKYNSLPPVSGPHDEQWVKAGIYQSAQPEGQLLHSLEHGYVILSYNCELENQKSNSKDQKDTTESAIGTASASLLTSMSSEECEILKKQLEQLANDKKVWKLAVVPRPSIDARIAVTAWTWIEKMDTFDKGKITAFIDAHRNHGPEQTME